MGVGGGGGGGKAGEGEGSGWAAVCGRVSCEHSTGFSLLFNMQIVDNK